MARLVLAAKQGEKRGVKKMSTNNVILEKSNQVATIRLNMPGSFNTLVDDLKVDLLKAVETCTDDSDTKAVIITGSGKAFCAGGDINLFKESANTSDRLRQGLKLVNLVIVGIRRMPKPVIAAINGVTGGAGVSIAAACDLRICASSVKFKTGYTSIGLVPDGGWTLLVPRLIGFGKAMELLLLDSPFDAEQALQYGLVNKVVAPERLEEESYAIARKLAEGPSVSYAIIKENFNHAMYGLLERQLELERDGMIRAGRTADSKEGFAAFLEKRKPRFTGK